MQGNAVPSPLAIDISDVQYVDVVDAAAASDSITFKYFITNNKVGIQVFTPLASFPSGMESVLRTGLTGVIRYVKVLEYVPEFNSWYAELVGLPVKPTGDMIESLLGKVIDAQVGNGNKDG